MILTAIFNCDLFTPGEHISQGLVLVEGRHIRAVGRSHAIPLPVNTRLLDAQGGRVTPGLIDLGGVESSDNKVEAQGTTSYLLRVSARDEQDLPRIREAAAGLPSPAGSARVLGLHLVGSRPLDNDIPPHWQDVWLAADATIKLVTFDAAVSDTTPMLDAGIRVALPAVWSSDSGGESDTGGYSIHGRVARWGLSEEITPETDIYHLATLDHVRSAEPALLRTLLSSHRLILVGSDAEPLNTRSIRQLMASADTDFASAAAAATLAPANFLDLPLGHLVAEAPADLICWTRHGDLAWTMVNGEIVSP
jgi:hypothetical protein